jgi:hypothetical protein
VTSGAVVSAGSVAAPVIHLGFRHDAFNRHDFGDCGSLDLCSCQHKPHSISTRGL